MAPMSIYEERRNVNYPYKLMVRHKLYHEDIDAEQTFIISPRKPEVLSNAVKSPL